MTFNQIVILNKNSIQFDTDGFIDDDELKAAVKVNRFELNPIIMLV